MRQLQKRRKYRSSGQREEFKPLELKRDTDQTAYLLIPSIGAEVRGDIDTLTEIILRLIIKSREL